MRPILRQGARAAGRSRSCHRPSTSSFRAFSSAPARNNDARPPNGVGTNEHNAWVEGQREEARRDAATKREVTATEEVAPEHDAEPREPRGRLSRRALRQRRFTDVPKPPPVPGWFLRENVILRTTPTAEKGAEQGEKTVLQCVDAETGHVLFTVPYDRVYGSGKRHPLVNLQGQLLDVSAVDWTGPQDIRSARDEDALVRQIVASRARDKAEIDPKALAELLVELPKELRERVLETEARERREGQGAEASAEKQARSSVSPTFFDQSAPEQWGAALATAPSVTADEPPHESARRPALDMRSIGVRPPPHSAADTPTFSWLLLAAETSLRAALSLPKQNQNANHFVSSRVDLSLTCPDDESHAQLDQLVESLASNVNADIVRLDANDFEELTADYIGGGHDGPGSWAGLGYDVFNGYVASGVARNKVFSLSPEEEGEEYDPDEDEEFDEEEEEEDDEHEGRNGGEGGPGPFSTIGDLRKAMRSHRGEIEKALKGAGIAGIQLGTPKIISVGVPPGQGPWAQMMAGRGDRGSAGTAFDGDLGGNGDTDPRLMALLEGLVDAARLKRSSQTAVGANPTKAAIQSWTSTTATAKMVSDFFHDSTNGLRYSYSKKAVSNAAQNAYPVPRSEQRTIIHVRELRDLHRSPLGADIVRHLVRVVQKRRRAGESVVIVGTTAQEDENPFWSSNKHDNDSGAFRQISVPPLFESSKLSSKAQGMRDKLEAALLPDTDEGKRKAYETGYHRILDINLRHIQSMLRRLRPQQEIDFRSDRARQQLGPATTQILASKVLSLDQVQSLVLTALGLAEGELPSEAITPVHVAMAATVIRNSAQVFHAWLRISKMDEMMSAKDKLAQATSSKSASRTPSNKAAPATSTKVEAIKKSCNPHESRLLPGVVDSANIRTTFSSVHAPPSTIEALRTLTSLSLLRPEAFTYGVLAADRLPGLLLYGPPGTGKTLLAKAVAKESAATVLEVTGAQIYEKYVGEGEKMVRAVFSLAKKLSPCVVFIDEADAIFGSRGGGGAGNRNTHREIINQFLREWDGMDDHGVFVMVASNRPFDLDDAVLRRLPRRVLVDLPVARDRQAILAIHLGGETLAPEVDLAKLAERTPLYSGSDLKNLCVAAALAAVREENELLAKHTAANAAGASPPPSSSSTIDEESSETTATTAASEQAAPPFQLPEKRTLRPRHFEKAIQEISASISEDMGSLTAIRKFDEQFGDRRGRKKKSGYGFGLGSEAEVGGSGQDVRVRPVEETGGAR